MDLSFGVSMTALRSARLGLVFLLALICISCGDTFRPVAIPVTPNPPDPASLHYALIVSQNVDIVPDVNNPGNTVPVFNPGATTRIDVSGDTNIQVARVGLGPVHATILPNGNKVYVANIVEDTVSEYSPSASRISSRLRVYDTKRRCLCREFRQCDSFGNQHHFQRAHYDHSGWDDSCGNY